MCGCVFDSFCACIPELNLYISKLDLRHLKVTQLTLDYLNHPHSSLIERGRRDSRSVYNPPALWARACWILRSLHCHVPRPCQEA